jgi:hypothetical protein
MSLLPKTYPHTSFARYGSNNSFTMAVGVMAGGVVCNARLDVDEVGMISEVERSNTQP